MSSLARLCSKASYRNLIYYSISQKTIDPVSLGYDAARIGHMNILKDLRVVNPHIYQSVAVRAYTLGDDHTYSLVQAELEEIAHDR